MFGTVQAVYAAPPTTGLVASAAPVPDPEARWEQGLAWVSERCGAAYQLLPWCDTAAVPGAFTPDGFSAVYYRPPTVRFAVRCSTMGGQIDTELVRRVAEATTPYVIAEELCQGTLTQADPFTAPYGSTQTTNHYLAGDSSTTVGGSATTALAAVGRLEEAAGVAARGQQVVLHIPRVILPQIWTGYVRRVGNVLYTPTDNIVIADAAYDGTGPANQAAGATVWAYATPPVQVRVSPLQVIEDPAQVVDRASNTRTVWAERVFAATFDPCVHLATEITV